MNTYLDRYCERLEPGLWAEPLNVVSNLAFAVAAVALYRVYRESPHAGREVPWLIALVAAIGIGSAFWHVFAQRWAEYADAMPILLFISLYLVVALYRRVTTRWAWVLALFALFHIANYATQVALPAGYLNGSGFYLPTWLTLVLMGLYLLWRRHPDAPRFGIAALWFLLALGFRTLDPSLCAAVPIGTHFLWHLLIAVVVYQLVAVLIVTKQGER